MLNYDDILEGKISQVEKGVPLEQVLQDLPPEAKELEPLIRLAAAVRAAPHPEPLSDHVEAQRQQVMAAAILNTRPVQRRGNPNARSIPLPRKTWGWLGAGALTAAAGALLLCVLMAFGISRWFAGRNIDSAQVAVVTGQVQVASARTLSGEVKSWKNIEPGYRLTRGDRLRTLGASSATLVFYEGTRTFVSPNTELSFAELNGSSGGEIQVRIDQYAGAIWNIVTPLKGEKSFFLVHTASGTASVHGTSFAVKVSGGLAQFAVNTGVVKVQNEGHEVTLEAGQATSTRPDGTIAQPTYQFDIQGSLTGMDSETGEWTVSGLQFQVNEATAVSGDPQLGDTVEVTGRILAGGVRVADTLEPAGDSSQTASFTGILEKQSGDFWTISGTQVKVYGDTQVDPTVQTGSPVRVTVNILENGEWLALQIQSLANDTPEATPVPTRTADPNAVPGYSFTPGEIETKGCWNGDFSLSGTLRNTAADAKDYAAGVQLGYRIDQGGEYVRSVELDPDGWARLDAGQEEAFNIHVSLNEQWASAPDDTQVKMRVFIVSATNRPDHLNGQLTVTIENGCKQATATPHATSTATAGSKPDAPTDNAPDAGETPAASPNTETPDQAPEAVTGQCVGTDQHPTGLKLAQRYNVSYEKIMFWFCQHYGFGEIDLAYSLSSQSGRTVEEIFALRAKGMGWGEIKQLLLPEKQKENKDNPGQDKQDKQDKNPKEKKH